MNVICILLDTLRRDHLGCYGNRTIETPNLDRLAQNGARFDNAYIGSYPCMPARQDLWTGKLNFLRRGWSPLEYDEPDLITLLRNHGKTTMLITDHYHLWQNGSGNYHTSFHGMEIIRGQEMDNWVTGSNEPLRYPASEEKLHVHWMRYALNSTRLREEKDYYAAQVFQKSIDWVEANRGTDDFFLMIDCFDPHEPFDPPPGYAEKYSQGYSGEKVIWPRYGDSARYTPEELEYIHALYCGEVTFVDHWFGRFYEKLESLGMLDNTMVIVTSDHGFLFGEHQWIGKHSRILYQDIARTPLLIQHPDIVPGSVFTPLVQMPDITSTILQAMGIEVPAEMHGQSLVPLWNLSLRCEGGIHDRDAIIFGVFGGALYCTDGEWLLVKKPVEGNVPLYWYTRSYYMNWDFGQKNLYADSQKRLDIWDGERFPVQYENAHPGHAAPTLILDEKQSRAKVPYLEDELYHIVSDHGQLREVSREAGQTLEQLKQTASRIMRRVNAPSEQWQRLGLDG